jgi:hypothetical protein
VDYRRHGVARQLIAAVKKSDWSDQSDQSDQSDFPATIWRTPGNY